MVDRSKIDWEAVEREYRAGQLSVLEIGRLHSVSHTAINRRAARDGWLRDLSDKVRRSIAARLAAEPEQVSIEVSKVNEQVSIDTAADRVIALVREHRSDIGIGRRIVNMLFTELQEATEHRFEIEEDVEAETADDESLKRRTRMLKAVSLPSRAGTISSLSIAMKNLVGLERQAFNIESSADSPVLAILDATTEQRRRAALGLLLAKQDDA